MTSPFAQFFENVNFYSSYKGLLAHQVWFDLGQGKQSYGGGGGAFRPPQVENVLNRPGEIGLTQSSSFAHFTLSFKSLYLLNSLHSFYLSYYSSYSYTFHLACRQEIFIAPTFSLFNQSNFGKFVEKNSSMMCQVCKLKYVLG